MKNLNIKQVLSVKLQSVFFLGEGDKTSPESPSAWGRLAKHQFLVNSPFNLFAVSL